MPGPDGNLTQKTGECTSDFKLAYKLGSSVRVRGEIPLLLIVGGKLEGLDKKFITHFS